MFGRFTRDDRMLLAFATQEAADLGHTRLGNDHLVLGMLCNARSPLFEVLGAQGMTLAPARDAVRAYHDEHDTDDEAAADESAAERYAEDREALRSIGIDLDKLRAAVQDRFGDDLADGWAERPHRGRGHRGRGERGPGERRRGHRHGPHGHGRRGEFGRGGPGFARGEFGPRGDFGPRGPFGPGGPGGPFGPGDSDSDAEHDRPDADGPFGWDGPWEPGRGRRGPRGRGGRPRFAPETRDALAAAVSIARERDDDRLRPEYLLLGILEVDDAASRAVIESVGAPEDLKAAVLASLPDQGAEV